MKINQVEELVGITKKNIRFYEDQGLLAPRRNLENGYRDYGQEEVDILLRIKLLRKLGVPIEEIRLLFSGGATLGDGMRRHMITLEREQRNLQTSLDFCRELQNVEIPVSSLEAGALLEQMAQAEAGGASFRNAGSRDVKNPYIAPAVITAVVVAFLAALMGLILWAVIRAPEEAPPLWFVAVILGLFAAMAAGTVLALGQRIREIRKGEMDDARYY